MIYIVLRYAVLGLCLTGWAGKAAANGWEHAAVPFSTLVDALSHGDEALRFRAAHSLGARGDRRAVAPLIKALQRPESAAAVRAAIFAALGRLGARRAVALLNDCLRQESRDDIRAVCARSLGHIGSEKGLAPLLKAIENDPSFLVKSRATDALGAFNHDEAARTLAGLMSAPENRGLRRRAIIALGHTGADAAKETLRTALAEARSDDEREAIIAGLGRLKAGAALEEIHAFTDKAHPVRVRIAAVIALGDIRREDGARFLMDLLDDPDPEIRILTVRGLAKQSPRRATGRAAGRIAELVAAEARMLAARENADILRHPVPALASLAVQLECLRFLAANPGAPSALKAMLAAARPRAMARDSSVALKLGEGFYEVRRLALYGLGYAPSADAKALLEGPHGVGDRDPRIRQVAVRALGVQNGKNAAMRIIPFLRDPSADVRRTAAMTLGRVATAGADAVAALMAALADANALVRREAALSLGYLGDGKALAALKAVQANDADENVRNAAGFSLRQLDGASPR